MEQRRIAKTDLDVSVIGLGGNNFGLFAGADQSADIINKALDLGINFIDTADVYGDSEVILGQALSLRREQVVLATKFGMALPDAPGGGHPDYVAKALERSLKRLNTDYIDLYYLHAPDPSVPIEETIGAMDNLVKSGKVRHIGCSNMTPELLTDAANAAKASGAAGFCASQEAYNLLQRGAESTVMPAVQRLGMNLIPYFPLASGLLTGKHKRGAAPKKGSRFDIWKDYTSTLLTEQNYARIERLTAFAMGHGRTLIELAFAWLLSNELIPSVIAGATSPVQVETNAKMGGWRLSGTELAEIDQILRI